MKIRTGIAVNKEELDYNMDLIRQELRANIQVVEQLIRDFQQYADQESTSKALEVLKGYAREDIIAILKRMILTFNDIISKTFELQDRYEQLCGHCSLNEVELEDNIEAVNKMIRRTEEIKYEVINVEGMSIEPINQFLEELKELRDMYVDKLDGLLEFNRYTSNIFDEENSELAKIASDFNSLSDKLGNVNSPFGMMLSTTELSIKKTSHGQVKDIPLNEQEELVGISKTDFSNMYKELYGFNDEDIELIWKAKVACYQKYGKVDGEYQFCLLMGRIGYNAYSDSETQSSLWDNTTGKFGYNDPRDYMINELNMSREEANKLYYRVRLQHVAHQVELDSQFSIVDDTNNNTAEYFSFYNYLNSQIDSETGKIYTEDKKEEIMKDIEKNQQQSKYYYLWEHCLQGIDDMKEATESKHDFTHQMITTATIQYKEDVLKGMVDGKFPITIPDLSGDDNWDDESGWFGDIFGITIYGETHVPPSMSNSDYKSDLDASNILSLQSELSSEGNRVSYDEASKIYYERIRSGEINRATYFKTNNPEVFNKIIDQAYKEYFKRNYGKPPQDYAPLYGIPIAPEGVINYNKEMEEQQKKYEEKRKEFDLLTDEQKIEHLSEEAKNFYYSLQNDSNDYIER